MMQKVFANLLLAHVPLAALVGDRVDWDVTPQGLPKPSIAMFVVSGVTDYTMTGPSGLTMTRVQIDSRAKSAVDARAVADAVQDWLSGYRGVFAGIKFQGIFVAMQRSRFDKDAAASWYTDSRDYEIHWAKA